MAGCTAPPRQIGMAGPNDALAILTAGAVFDRKRLTRDSELVQPRQVRS